MRTGKSLEAGLGAPALSVVIPVFNEQDWIARSIDALQSALENAHWSAQIVVVDDGSTDDTPHRLKQLAARNPRICIIRQENRGRFSARLAGIEACTGDRVLLVDSRVIVHPEALAYLRQQLSENPPRRVWNGHVHVDSIGGPYGDFWAGLVAVAWRRYFANPTCTSYSLDEFDRYPKGTGFFCAPRDLLLAAAGSFTSLFSDGRYASDDTRMLRWIASRESINLSPSFSATYHSRDALGKFLTHAFFRGTTFVDGYLDSPGPVRRVAGLATILGTAAMPLIAKRPRSALVVAATACGAAGLAVHLSGGTARQSRAVASLLPLFVLSFGAGVARGLGLAVGRMLRR
ncbi:glycosyltransferase [Pseudonocardia sp. RS11V-5]|uniref:glycosyltransferase family 2 protein n=1 Tax=Pseudonocardia terrae TaxID=2905831 RepID=UPI001E489053|nr:glycosyltransferase family 2 protein [Pseudonocardia terrae]MCE3550358.1 glycosyltransferase [Pseudonocardia terrae]